MLKIRRPLGRLIFNMGIAIPGKTVFLIETAPRSPQTIHIQHNIYTIRWFNAKPHCYALELRLYCIKPSHWYQNISRLGINQNYIIPFLTHEGIFIYDMLCRKGRDVDSSLATVCWFKGSRVALTWLRINLSIYYLIILYVIWCAYSTWPEVRHHNTISFRNR